MTRWNHSIDNPSPLISYTPEWMWHIPTDALDPKTPSYANGSTATTTDGIGATMTFSFIGTGVWVYGAKRSNHGFYNVSINGEKSTLNGNDPNDLFQQLVFGKRDLELGQHTLTIVNAGSLTNDTVNVWFDVDWLVWETEYDGPGGPINAQVTESTFENSHPRFQYTPASEWNQQTYSNGDMNGTTEVTSSSQAQLTFTFDGDAIALYGTMDPGHGNYTANVGNTQTRTLSGEWNSTAYQQMLYYAEGLGAGQHNLVVQNLPTSPSQEFFTVDFAKTWIARGGSGGPGTVTPPKEEGINKGAVVGGVIGGVVLLAALAFILVFFVRWRRKRNLQYAARYSASPFSLSAGGDISPFRGAYTVRYSASRDPGSAKSANSDSQRIHHSNPSMGSVSSSITDSSTQQLVAGQYGENAFPMSRLPHSPANGSIPSTSENPPLSLHPDTDYYHANNRTPSGSSVQNQPAFIPPSSTLNVPISGAREPPLSSSPSRPRKDVTERQAQIHAILGGAPPAEGTSSSTRSTTPPSVTAPAAQSPTPVLRAEDAGSLSVLPPDYFQATASRPEWR